MTTDEIGFDEGADAVDFQLLGAMSGEVPRRLVINGCYGGFSLSHAAVMAFAKRKGLTLYQSVDDISVKHFGPLTDENAASYRGPINYYTVPPEQYAECSKKWRAEDGNYCRINATDWYFSPRAIPRDDADLLAVVEELGDAANGAYAKLEVVEIPADVQWTVEDYDGLERVAEVHRTWPA